MKIDKHIITYRIFENFRKILIPSSLKTCTELDNSATYHADKIGISMMKEDTNIAKRANEIITQEVASPNRIIITNK